MEWILPFIVWISAVAASSYKFPLISKQLRIAPLSPDADGADVVTGAGPFQIDERSSDKVARSNVQNAPDERSFKTVKRRGQVAVTSRITFPGPSERAGDDSDLEVPESCRNFTFCEDAHDYPQEEVDALISKSSTSLKLHLDRLPTDTPDINQRWGNYDQTVELCNFVEKLIYPKQALGTDGKWHSIVNRQQNPVQGFLVEICDTSGGESCNSIAEFVSGYVSSCNQKFVWRRATAFKKTSDGLKTFDTDIKLPSCCTCTGKAILN